MPTVEELESGKPLTLKELTTTYRWQDRDYPLPEDAHISRLCNNLKGLAERSDLVTILLAGKSDSGKTTLTRTIIHRICCNLKRGEEPYILQWFNGKDLHKIAEKINALPKNKKYALVFDDASFVLDQAKPNEKKAIAQFFTEIRHHLEDHTTSEFKKPRMFLFINIHYGRAIMPMLRDSYCRILTSMSSEDAKNWKEAIGWEHQYKIMRFQKQFASQMMNGWFYLKMGGYRYATNFPFRVALYSDLSGVNSLLYPKEGCEICKPPKSVIGKVRKTKTEQATIELPVVE